MRMGTWRGDRRQRALNELGCMLYPLHRGVLRRAPVSFSRAERIGSAFAILREGMPFVSGDKGGAMKRFGQAMLFKGDYALIMLGFGLYWAWVDCAFFAPLLYRPALPDDLPLSLVHLFVMGWSLLPPLAVVALRPGATLQKSSVILLFSGAGAACNALLVACSLGGGAVALVSAVGLGGLGMGLGALAWGCQIAMHGSEGASVCIPGTFVASVGVGLLVQALPFEISSAVVALLPVASGVLLATLVRKRATGADDDAPVGKDGRPFVVRARSVRANVSEVLDIVPMHFMVILFLFCAAFGIMQYLLVLPHVESGGITEQNIAVRGLIALVVLVGFGMLSWKPDVAYKIGLLLITAGFLATPFLKSIPLSSSIVMAGYTCFDMMGWIIVAALAVRHERCAGGVIALSRLFELGGVLCGGVVGVLATGWAWADDANMAIVSTAIAYALVAAAVLLLYRGSTNVWPLMERSAPQDGLRSQRGALVVSAMSERYGLTPRETDMLGFFAAGRSIPWIAEHEGISEGTVRSHTRHLYEKIDVHSRQELLDVIEEAFSQAQV